MAVIAESGGSFPIMLFLQAGDQTTTSNAAQNITELVSPTLLAGKRYAFEGYIHTGCNTGNGLKFAVVTPTSSTQWFIIQGTGTVGTTNLVSQTITASATLMATACNTANNATGGVTINGTVTIGNAGTVQFQFASSTNGNTSTIFQEGTFIKIWELT